MSEPLSAARDLQEVLQYLLESQADDFHRQLLKGQVVPDVDVEQPAWDEVYEAYVAQGEDPDPSEEGLFSWLALHGRHHVYCAATRLDRALQEVG